ncbi:hypothetical protein RHMOL_Rhmol09G0212500 [Rhododendron molle]|uniref:Uncharacterized protein n=1 Tax=Rhododendron molle TaxID=49168 RepID=A0ACC0MFZ9_RHOML|nr:hypothetical protein RHMOL_Rhmol09G0212500 [Rhododendron molle]
MVSMTSLCGGIHTISTNRNESNVHSLLKRVNKIALGTKSSDSPTVPFLWGSCCAENKIENITN